MGMMRAVRPLRHALTRSVNLAPRWGAFPLVRVEATPASNWHRFDRFFCAGASYEESVAARLREALEATTCNVKDQSGGCGSSYAIVVEAESFRGKSRVQRQRMVQEVIREDIAKWHAVTIQANVPETTSSSS